MVSKLADVNANERALLDQCNDLLSTVASMQVSFCILYISLFLSILCFSVSHMEQKTFPGNRVQPENTNIATRTPAHQLNRTRHHKGIGS